MPSAGKVWEDLVEWFGRSTDRHNAYASQTDETEHYSPALKAGLKFNVCAGFVVVHILRNMLPLLSKREIMKFYLRVVVI